MVKERIIQIAIKRQYSSNKFRYSVSGGEYKEGLEEEELEEGGMEVEGVVVVIQKKSEFWPAHLKFVEYYQIALGGDKLI
jgi:hypothetical protein